jgi:hypothetical protein
MAVISGADNILASLNMDMNGKDITPPPPSAKHKKIGKSSEDKHEDCYCGWLMSLSQAQVPAEFRAFRAFIESGGVMPEQEKSDRIYLVVPFIKKDEARRLGARWDPSKKHWYTSPGAKEKDLLIEKFGQAKI